MGLDVKGKRNFTFRVLKKGGKGCTRMFCVEIYREHLSRKCTRATYDTFLDDFPKNMPPFWGKHPTLRTKTSCLRHHQNISSFGMSQPTSKMFWFSVFVKCFLFWCLFGHMIASPKSCHWPKHKIRSFEGKETLHETLQTTNRQKNDNERKQQHLDGHDGNCR